MNLSNEIAGLVSDTDQLEAIVYETYANMNAEDKNKFVDYLDGKLTDVYEKMLQQKSDKFEIMFVQCASLGWSLIVQKFYEKRV